MRVLRFWEPGERKAMSQTPATLWNIQGASEKAGTSLVIQHLRIHLPMPGTWV